MRLKPRKRSNKTLIKLLDVYDADTDEIRSIWLANPSKLNCPILRTCLECNLCHVRRD